MKPQMLVQQYIRKPHHPTYLVSDGCILALVAFFTCICDGKLQSRRAVLAMIES